MKRLVFFLCLITYGNGCVWAEENHVTVYNNNLGLVRQIRAVDLGKGEKAIRLTDVATTLIPESVHLRPLDRNPGFRVLGQVFQYDLASPERVLDKMVGKSIEVLIDSEEYIQGVLLNKYHNSLLLQTEDGIRLLPRNDEMLINIKEMPEGLVTRPTLVWEVAHIKEGKQNFELSYLSTGLDWDAAYVGILNEQSTSMDLDAWASIRNESGVSFQDTSLKLVAGDVHRAPEERSFRRMAKGAGPMAAAEHDRGPTIDERAFFEYYVYTLEKPLTLKDKTVQQIALRPRTTVKTKKQFTYNHRRSSEGVEVRIVFQNDEENGLGVPLPSGVVRVYQKEKDDMFFLGEHRITHTARKEEVEIPVGKAFDLSCERSVMESRRISDRQERQTVVIELTNNKIKEDVTIIVEESMAHRSWKIEKRTHEFTKKDIRQIQFTIPVSAGSKASLRYTVLYSW